MTRFDKPRRFPQNSPLATAFNQARHETKAALFGTDFDDTPGWFCWRKPFGCGCRLADFHRTKSVCLTLHQAIRRHKNDDWKLPTRAAFRTVDGRAQAEHNHDLKQAAAKGRVTGDLETTLAHNQKALKTNRLTVWVFADLEERDAALYPMYTSAPLTVRCPSCGFSNRIPSIRGVPTVEKGKLKK